MMPEYQATYFSWETPLLPAAAAWLVNHATASSSASFRDGLDFDIDLGGLDVVLPSSRAKSRLADHLKGICDQRGLRARVPHFLTVGELPPRLVTSHMPAAMEFEQTLAWAGVLAEIDRESLSILLPHPPEIDAMDGWLELGGTLRRLSTSLASENLTFSQVLANATNATEISRWDLLCRLWSNYLRLLADAGRADPSAVALEAISTQSCTTSRPIVLIGVTDLSPMLQAMLAQTKAPLQVLIAAPQMLADRFGRFGNLIESAWQDHHLPLQHEHLVAADSMADQAETVFELLRSHQARRPSETVTVGVTDESQVAAIATQCEWHDIATHRNLGHTVGHTAVGRVIDLMVSFLQNRTWRTLAALIRHADVYRMLDHSLGDDNATRWLAQIDQLISETYPVHVDQPTSASAPQSAIALRVVQRINRWLAPIAGARRPIGFWCEPLIEILTELYPQATSDSDRMTTDRTLRAFDVVKDLLERFATLSEMLDTAVDGSLALSILAARITELRIAEEHESGQVEILGWLDLALDDAPAMIVCGMNHPFVPEAIPGDAFLPPALRRRLHQAANERRYARDVVAMHQMIACRDQIWFVVGKHAADGSPTPPSRLLAASTADHSAALVCRLLDKKRRESSAVVSTSDRNDPVFFQPVAVTPGKTIQTISVTAFSDYLICPYRFFLRHVEKLRPLDDAGFELAANQFGDLVHGALEWWGDSDAKHETNPSKIADDLIAQLHAYANHKWGGNAATTVKLQMRQAERRLRAVAMQQALRIADGWEIHAVEARVDDRPTHHLTGAKKRPTGITIDGKFTGITGRFDRIDHHPATNRWAILDYKTHGHKPEKKHLKSSTDGVTRWINLQLPLYRRMIPDLGIHAPADEVQLGYFNISEKESETKINIAQFTPEQFAEADALILWCVRQIRDGHFEPTTQPVEYDDYEMMFNPSGSFGWIEDEENFEDASEVSE